MDRTSVLILLDHSISLFVISPLVVAYWRGTWQLLDIFLEPEDRILSSCLSLIFGSIVCVLLSVNQYWIERVLSYNERPVLFHFFSRIYSLVFGFACVNHWRGVWILWDEITGFSLTSGLISGFLGGGVLVVLRGINNLLSSPLLVVRDHPSEYFRVPNIFPRQDNSCLSFLNCCYSIVVIGYPVVSFWRGIWTTTDFLLYPLDVALSSKLSLALGLTFLLISFATENLFSSLLTRLSGITRLLANDLFLLFASFGTVHYWRGIWNLMNIYLFTEDYALSNWVTTFVGSTILIIMNCSNTTQVRLAKMDGMQEDAKGVIFPNQYLQLYSKVPTKEISKKLWMEEEASKFLSNVKDVDTRTVP